MPLDPDKKQKATKIESLVQVFLPPHVQDAPELKIGYWLFKIVSKLPKPISFFINTAVVKESIAIPGLVAGTFAAAFPFFKSMAADRMQNIWIRLFVKKDAPLTGNLTGLNGGESKPIKDCLIAHQELLTEMRESSPDKPIFRESLIHLKESNPNIEELHEFFQQWHIDWEVFEKNHPKIIKDLGLKTKNPSTGLKELDCNQCILALEDPGFCDALFTEYFEYQTTQSLEKSLLSNLLAKRQANFEKMVDLNLDKPDFMQWAAQLTDKNHSGEELQELFKTWHIHLDVFFEKHPEVLKDWDLESMNVVTGSKEFDPDKFREALGDTKFCHALFTEYCEYQDAQAIITRNVLKTLAAKKQEIERPSFHFKVATSGMSFASSLCLTTALVVVKSLLIAGVIAVPAFVSTLTGGFALGFGILLMGIGILYLVLNKPETLKKTITSIKASVVQFVLNYQKWRFKRTLNKFLKLQSKQISLQEELQLHKVHHKFQGQLEKLADEVRARADKVDQWVTVMQPLKRSLIEAGWKDFMNKAQKDYERNQGISLKVSGFAERPADWDLADELAENLVSGGMLPDEETIELLQERMGIDIVSVMSSAPSGQLREEVALAIREFGAMDQAATEQFILKKFKEVEKANRKQKQDIPTEKAGH